jgi:pimeloyl-ACP methyl ester carboxylesterase
MQTIYCISGLGVDDRLFRRMEIDGFTLKHIRWVNAEKGDTMQSYAAKLIPQIEDENPIIIGVSFGGMLAVELAEQLNTKQVIIISSSKGQKEIPLMYRLFGRSGLIRLVPVEIVKHIFFILYYLFGVKIKEDKALLKAIVRDTDNPFIRWSTLALTKWNRKTWPIGIVHIHGTNDKIIYPWNVKPDYWIKGGGHLIILLNYQEINTIMTQVLNKSVG